MRARALILHALLVATIQLARSITDDETSQQILGEGIVSALMITGIAGQYPLPLNWPPTTDCGFVTMSPDQRTVHLVVSSSHYFRNSMISRARTEVTAIIIEADEAIAEHNRHVFLSTHSQEPVARRREIYDTGHIPGSIFVDLQESLARPPLEGEGRNPLPRREDFQETVRAWGLQLDDDIVVYGHGTSAVQNRAWWTLRHAGFTNVRILNGGITAWKAAGGPLSTEDVTRTPSDVVIEWGKLRTVTADEAVAVPKNGGVLIDARHAQRFNGLQTPKDPRPGHIPGAVNAPWVDNLDELDRLLPAELLREKFEALGVTLDTDVTVYCGSGVSAPQLAVALDRAGFAIPSLFVGSWSEWAADANRPVEV